MQEPGKCSFAHVLGKGGLGTVYKGKLPKGNQDVAVASMSRTSHANIVSVLGFCYEGNKRAIIYEFMPNGSLDKFISKSMSAKMDWEMLYDIALGVSCGLEYLHNRCVSMIVHFEIATNILMDKDLCPKISDFRLDKLYYNKESIMSMLDARGTFRYIAPEVFSQNFGGVLHIYIEMEKSFNNFGSNNCSIYFPDWIYTDFEKGEIMKIFEDQITEEEKMAKKIILVDPSDRPSMIKVIAILEGSPEALHIPPKPLCFVYPQQQFQKFLKL
ncbi:hypothetical protein EUTSA_v10028202mg [Eutrema salsugineum]|uniref:Protein kinase domain-containing protein n=1 Tax=Eutrema salsugineum TaxID=72664 RepID=V4LTT4_EUTSA|nr:hypothetical protein EUTSA_v10028202mg [Eutrema salsugineum]